MASGVEVTITAGTVKFDPDDQRWVDQAATLYAALREEAGAVLQRGVPEPGAKGAVDTVVLALGSSGALTAAVACFRAWLARDKTRTLTVAWTDDTGDEQTVTVTGDNIDRASFQALAEAAGKRLGG
jgi:NADPH-dependent glutamate synthase beta subunit-like oxidoreductase